MSKSQYVRKPIRGLNEKARDWAKANNNFNFLADSWIAASDAAFKFEDKDSYVRKNCWCEPQVPPIPTYKKPELFIPILTLVISAIICLLGLILCCTLFEDFFERLYGMSYLGFPFFVFISSIVIIANRKNIASKMYNNQVNDRATAILNHNNWKKEKDRLEQEWAKQKQMLKEKSDKLNIELKEAEAQLIKYSTIGKNSIYNLIKNELVYYYDFSDETCVNDAINEVAYEICQHPELTFYQVIDMIKQDREWYRLDKYVDDNDLQAFLETVPKSKLENEQWLRTTNFFGDIE